MVKRRILFNFSTTKCTCCRRKEGSWHRWVTLTIFGCRMDLFRYIGKCRHCDAPF